MEINGLVEGKKLLIEFDRNKKPQTVIEVDPNSDELYFQSPHPKILNYKICKSEPNMKNAGITFYHLDDFFAELFKIDTTKIIKTILRDFMEFEEKSISLDTKDGVSHTFKIDTLKRILLPSINSLDTFYYIPCPNDNTNLTVCFGRLLFELVSRNLYNEENHKKAYFNEYLHTLSKICLINKEDIKCPLSIVYSLLQFPEFQYPSELKAENPNKIDFEKLITDLKNQLLNPKQFSIYQSWQCIFYFLSTKGISYNYTLDKTTFIGKLYKEYDNIDKVKEVAAEFETAKIRYLMLLDEKLERSYSNNPNVNIEEYIKEYENIQKGLDSSYVPTEILIKFGIFYQQLFYYKKIQLYFNESESYFNKAMERNDHTAYFCLAKLYHYCLKPDQLVKQLETVKSLYKTIIERRTDEKLWRLANYHYALLLKRFHYPLNQYIVNLQNSQIDNKEKINNGSMLSNIYFNVPYSNVSNFNRDVFKDYYQNKYEMLREKK